MAFPISKTDLDNGLTIVLKEMHHAPVISFMVWYRVGSRNEVPGQTGISHWVEHMMFKGTRQFPASRLDRLISREGGQWNAFTWLDFTAYYETLPAHRIDLALELESDRLVNLRMDAADVEAERRVIISERQMYENDPHFQLNEALSAMAFRVHPYHHEVIGDLVDLQTMSQLDLFEYYRRNYVPNNAIVVVVGDFESSEMLAKIDAFFGGIPAGETAVPITRQEPEQKGERRLTIEGTDETAYLIYAFRAPAATNPDFFPLVLLNAALAGGGSLGMFGSINSNKSSRLYKAMVDTELAAAASGSLMPTVDPHLYTINVVARHGRSLDEIEAALQAELDRLYVDPVTPYELEKALKQAKAEFVLAGESITGQAQLLGMAEAVAGDYRWYETVLNKLRAVSLADIERVRSAYLRNRSLTVGRYEARG